jgi:hypothetical protein
LIFFSPLFPDMEPCGANRVIFLAIGEAEAAEDASGVNIACLILASIIANIREIAMNRPMRRIAFLSFALGAAGALGAGVGR